MRLTANERLALVLECNREAPLYNGGKDAVLRLLAEIDELERDSERLDWLEKNCELWLEGGALSDADTLRESIDAAMNRSADGRLCANLGEKVL